MKKDKHLKIKEKILYDDVQKISKEIGTIQINRSNLFKHYNKLVEKYNEIDTRVNKRDVDKIKEQHRKDNRKIIEERLPEFMDKIRKEVTKELIVDNLQDTK